MFDIFKQDIKIGDKVKLFLTTGKEPEGIVESIGDNFVLLKINDLSQQRIFDKLIGGWLILESILKVTPELEEDLHHSYQDKIETKFQSLLQNANQLMDSLSESVLKTIIPTNAQITKVNFPLIYATTLRYQEILINSNKVADDRLFKELENFKAGSSLQVLISAEEKHQKLNVYAISLPYQIDILINKLIKHLEAKELNLSSLTISILRSQINNNKFLGAIIADLNSLKYFQKKYERTKKKINDPPPVKNKLFKSVEIEINELIRNSKFDFALSQIDNELSKAYIDDKYKSSLLLKRAQIYSSINNPSASETAYQELVLLNESIKSSGNNLSHLYTELARLQALKIDKQAQALESVKKALKYNPNNNYALNLLKQFEGRSGKSDLDISLKNLTDGQLLIEVDDDNTALSTMIDLDIKEHKYTHPEILRNDGQPTAFIAKLILEEAKKSSESSLSERYPLYLEAAKAFSELNVGSYDLQDYLQAVAYYSALKGNSLFVNFRNRVLNNDLDIIKLTRLKDSACSYYLESLNILSNIEPRQLLNILADYLKLNIVVYHISNNSSADFILIFRGQFADVFSNCLRNKNKNIESIAYSTIISCGASSIHAWNRLASLPKGTGRLYDEFHNSNNRKRVYDLINEVESSNTNLNLSPREFLKSAFQFRREKIGNFSDHISKIYTVEFEPQNITSIVLQWNQLTNYISLFSYTDKEIKSEIENLLSILQPYLNRNQSERTNILIQSRNIIEKQNNFINENTTYIGRTFFYGLLVKWKKEIDILLEEKITQSYPLLEIFIDPPYYIQSNGEITAPLLIKNSGEATADGFALKIICEATEYEDSVEMHFESEIEVGSENKVETSFVIPAQLLSESKAVEIKIEIQAIYQKKRLSSRLFEFTIEEEPVSTLEYDDIPWLDGPIPPEQLFKGRKKLIADLAQHYLSVEKDKPYILYGLTRTGKSSVLEYLNKNLEGNVFKNRGNEIRVLTFNWDLDEAAGFKNAGDFWKYILYQQTFEELEKYSIKYKFDISGLNMKENVRAKDFKIILEFLQTQKLYPIYFVDEFSFVKTLMDDGVINSAFLHTLRQFSLRGLASFIFAGTYDIKGLIKDPRYGITGQLVNAIEEQVNEINDNAAIELIEVINDKLSFTPEAISHIMFLSGNVPYFIQIICKYCGYYAVENNRRYIGYPELEKVIKILIGQNHSSPNSLVKKIPEQTFSNNQFSPTDPKEVAVLISCIAYINKNRIADPRGVGFAELQKLWAEQNITAFRPRLAEAINLLKEKKIISQEEDESLPVYKISVDLFRRWWANHSPDINLSLTTLTE